MNVFENSFLLSHSSCRSGTFDIANIFQNSIDRVQLVVFGLEFPHNVNLAFLGTRES